MGSWFHMYCYLSNKEIENPYENGDYYDENDSDDSDESTELPYEAIQLDIGDNGRYFQDLIIELCGHEEGKMYSLEELIDIFNKKLKNRSADEMIEFFSLIPDDNWRINDEELIDFAAIIKKIKGSKYVWLIRYYG